MASRGSSTTCVGGPREVISRLGPLEDVKMTPLSSGGTHVRVIWMVVDTLRIVGGSTKFSSSGVVVVIVGVIVDPLQHFQMSIQGGVSIYFISFVGFGGFTSLLDDGSTSVRTATTTTTTLQRITMVTIHHHLIPWILQKHFRPRWRNDSLPNTCTWIWKLCFMCNV